MKAGSRLFGLANLRRFVWLSAVALLMTWTAAPASAVLDHRGTFPYQFTNWDCGYPIDISGSQTEVVTYRAGRGTDVLFTVNYSWKETWTGPDGRSASAAGNGVFKQVKATLIAGTTYRVVAQNSGSPFAVFDPSGKALLRDRGNYTFTFTVDINNWDPTWTFVDDRVSGPHPSFYTDACKVIAPFMGSGSERYLTPRPMGSTGFPLNFYDYLPPSYTSTGAASPVIVFFNGYGESGDGTPNSVDKLLDAGLPRFINVGGWPVDRPFVVLAMQHVDTGFDFSSCEGIPWGGSCNMFVQDARNNAPPAFCTTPDEVHDFISYVVSHYNVDPHRVYATGLSCGAFGTWEYLAKYGHSQVAAAVPIAGEGRPAWANAGCGLADIPIWAFHGALDDVVDPNGSIVTMNNVQGCAGATADSAKVTVYPDRDHNSWDPAYDGQNGDDIYSWMLTHTNP